MKCIAFVQDITLADESSGYSLAIKIASANGPTIDNFVTSVTVPFGTSQASALASVKASVASVTNGRGRVTGVQSADVTVYGASIN